MLEIILLIVLSGKIGKKAKAKGYDKIGKYKWMLVGFWFLGEILGAVLGALVSSVIGGSIITVLIIAMMGASAGAYVAFGRVKALPVLHREEFEPSPVVNEGDAVTVNDMQFDPVPNPSGKANCSGCGKTDDVDKLLYNPMKGIYSHPQCVSRAAGVVKM